MSAASSVPAVPGQKHDDQKSRSQLASNHRHSVRSWSRDDGEVDRSSWPSEALVAKVSAAAGRRGAPRQRRDDPEAGVVHNNATHVR